MQIKATAKQETVMSRISWDISEESSQYIDWSLLFERGLSVEEVAEKVQRKIGKELIHNCRVKILKLYLRLCKRPSDMGRERTRSHVTMFLIQ